MGLAAHARSISKVPLPGFQALRVDLPAVKRRFQGIVESSKACRNHVAADLRFEGEAVGAGRGEGKTAFNAAAIAEPDSDFPPISILSD
jgi:hypothetical protein